MSSIFNGEYLNALVLPEHIVMRRRAEECFGEQFIAEELHRHQVDEAKADVDDHIDLIEKLKRDGENAIGTIFTVVAARVDKLTNSIGRTRFS